MVCLDYIEVDQAVQLDDSQFVCVNHVQLDDLEKVAQLDDGQVVHLDYIITDFWPTAYLAMVQVDHVSSLEVDCGSSLVLDYVSSLEVDYVPTDRGPTGLLDH